MRRAYAFVSTVILMSMLTILPSGPAHSYEVFAVGDIGTLFHNDGTDWNRVTGPVNNGTPTDFKVFSEDNIYTRIGGKIYHYDGESWNRFYTGPYDLYVTTMWIESETSMFLGGMDGDYAVVLHYDGVEWTESSFLSSFSSLLKIHGTSASDLYAVTSREIYYFDGVSWSDDLPMGVWDSVIWTTIWCESTNSVWVTGYDDDEEFVILNYDGSSWTEKIRLNDVYFYDLWGSGGGDLCAAGYTRIPSMQGLLLRKNGSWHMETFPEISSLYRVHGSSHDDVYAVGTIDYSYPVPDSGVVCHYDGVDWTVLPELMETSLHSVHAYSENFVIAGSYPGYMYLSDGVDWNRWLPEVTIDFKDVWGTSLNNLYALDVDGLIHRYDGTSWSEATGPGYPVDKIWGLSENEIYTVGADGVFLYDGVGWNQISAEPTNDIWGRSSTDIYTTTSGFHSSDVMHYDGSEWTVVVNYFSSCPSPDYDCEDYFNGVWGTPAGELFVVGYVHITDYENQKYWDSPEAHYWDGSTWEELECGGSFAQDFYMYDVWGSSGDYAFMTGSYDTRFFDGDAIDDIGGVGESVWSSGDEAWWAHSDYDGGYLGYYDGIDATTIHLNGLALHGVWGIGEAQPKVTVTVMTEPEGPEFTVGGAVFTEPHMFLSDVGATYEIGVESPQINGEEYYFIEWSDNGDTIHTIVVPDTNVIYVAYFNTPVDVTVTTDPEGLDVTVAGGTYPSPYIFSMLSNTEIEIGTLSPQRDKGTDYYFDEWSDGGDTTHVVTLPDSNVTYTAAFADVLTGDEAEPVPLMNVLNQNHPNPFNPNTTISFSLGECGHAFLAVYDVAGRLVRVLIDDVVEAGPRDVTWDGKDNAGRGVASGVYFYRLRAGEFTDTRKMVLLR